MNAVATDRFDPLPRRLDTTVELGRLGLEHGHVLPDARLAVSVCGSTGPVYAVLGGISAHRRVTDSADGPGWWTNIVGAGRALDTDRCRILSIDYLGSGDSSQPARIDEYAITPLDQAHALQRGLDALGIHRLDGLIGCSYGGLVGLVLAARFPLRANRVLVLCAAHRSATRTSAYRAIQRAIVRLSDASGRASEGVALARGLAMIGFRSGTELDRRFGQRPRFRDQQAVLPVEHYLSARGHDYAARTPAASFVCLSQSCDLVDLDPTTINVPLWLAGAQNDEIVPFDDLTLLADHAPGFRRLDRIDSLNGHDAFLTETEQVEAIVKRFVDGEDRS